MGNTSHGPAMDKWTPSGAGADFKLSQILASLEPYKKYVSSFGNLENTATAGSVHAFTPATWLSATRPDTGGPRAHMATTLDQVIAKIIGQETPLPSLEVASETIVQVGGGRRRVLYYFVFPRRRIASADGTESAKGFPAVVRRRRHAAGTRIDQQADRQPSRSDSRRHKVAAARPRKQ